MKIYDMVGLKEETHTYIFSHSLSMRARSFPGAVILALVFFVFHGNEARHNAGDLQKKEQDTWSLETKNCPREINLKGTVCPKP